jgi:hypothetical protein
MGIKRGSLFFKEAFWLPFVYAKETIRLYLGRRAIDAESIIEQLRESTVKILKMSKLHGIWIEGKQYIPIDIDTSVLDNSKSKKEGVSKTYRKVDGFQPIMAYAGKEGYMLDCELRPGSQHCQKGTVEFIMRLIGQLEKIKIGKRFLFRLDSGNDAWENLKTMISAGLNYFCIIKRNKRRECDEQWLKRAKRHGELTVPRKGKKVWVGSIQIHPCKNGETIKDVYCVFEIIERKIDRTGNRLLIPEIEVSTWWTNLKCGAEKVIELYHDHATSEQFHSELKHDMGIERLPSGKLDVNKILFAVAMNAYNTLRFLGQHAVVRESRNVHKRKRLGKVIRDVICVAGKLVRHARSLVFKIYENDPMLPVFFRVVHALNST